MKRLLAHAIRSSAGIKILEALIGLPPGSRERLESALQAPGVVPVVRFLVARRLLRLIRKVASPLAAPARRLLSRERAEGAEAAREGHAPGGGARFTPGSQGEPLRLPAVPRDRAFPRLIFQTWKSRTDIPFNYAQWSESFRRINPGFEHVLWDDFDNRRFIETFYPWFLPVYDAYPREIYRADAVRYFFLYQFGGLYADMDTECLKPVAPLFESGDVWLGRMGPDSDFPHSIPNAIMASRPRQEFWLLAIYLLLENAGMPGGPPAMVGKGPEAMTGPIVLKRTHDLYASSERHVVDEMIRGVAARLPESLQPQTGPSNIVLLEPETWYPIDWSNVLHFRLLSEITSERLLLGERAKQRLFPRSFLVTYWAHSWKAPG